MFHFIDQRLLVGQNCGHSSMTRKAESKPELVGQMKRNARHASANSVSRVRRFS
jgi:hypothetical protein